MLRSVFALQYCHLSAIDSLEIVLFLLFYEDMTLLIGTPYSIFQMVVKHLSVYSVGAAKWKLMAAVDLHPPCFFFKDSWGFLDLS